MRLEKHTEEEINEALAESGDATPTEEQLEGWREVHENLNNRIIADAGVNGWGPRITDISRIMFPELGEAAKKIALSPGTNTVLELLRNKKTAKVFPWHRSGLFGYDHITDDALEGAKFDVVFAYARYLSKVIEVKKGEASEHWIKRFAALFNHLADNSKIKWGILGPFMALPLADIEAEKQVKELMGQWKGENIEELNKKIQEVRRTVMAKSETMRIALMVYPYSELETGELNDWLGNPAFVEEGDIGTTDWSGLPEV